MLRHAPQAPPEATDMTPQEQPTRPPPTLTTAELTDWRRQLEHTIAFSGRHDPVPAVRADLPATLEDVLAAPESRTREHP